MKVYSFTKLIAENEKLSEDIEDCFIASIVRTIIGIKISLEKYNSTSGKYQEKEGPVIAQKMLAELGFKTRFDR